MDMTIKEEIYVVNRKLPTLHVSAHNLAGCIAIARHATLTPTSSKVLLHLFYMPVLTAPPKVEGVMFGNNVVKNGRIHQEIKWNVPVLRYNRFPEYILRYADSRRNRSKQSSVPNTTLQLPFSTTNITYYIRVAVRSAGDQKRGDFSDPVSITYTSEFVCRLA